ncbi:MAG: phosphotransferase [Chloroflexota bacterium]
MEQRFLNALADNYDMGEMTLSLLGQGAKHVYHIQRQNGPDWVVRIFPPKPGPGLAHAANRQAQMLAYLEAHDYPTEWVVRTRAGELVAPVEDWALLVTTYVGRSLHAWAPASGSFTSHEAMTVTPDIYRQLGMALAKLHTVPIDPAQNLPRGGMLPKRELTWIGPYVVDAAEHVTPEYQTWYDELLPAIQQAHHCEDLDFVLVHCDPNLGNAAIDEQGKVVLIDWDVVGLGPAVLDLGCLLINCVTPDFAPDADAVHAVMDGYRQHSILSALELERLADMVPSQILVTLGGYLPDIMKGEISEDELIYGLTYPQWQAKYRAATGIVAIAQDY